MGSFDHEHSCCIPTESREAHRLLPADTETAPATAMLRSTYYAALHGVGIPAFARRLRDAGVILCYHNVSPARDGPPSGDPGVHLALEKFATQMRSEEHTSELQSRGHLVCRLLLEKKNTLHEPPKPGEEVRTLIGRTRRTSITI